MSLAKGTLLIGWAMVVSAGLIRIAVLQEEVREAQAAIAGLRQEVLEARDVSVEEARAECDQARAEVRLLQAEATGLLNKLLLSLNELSPPTHRSLGPPVWVDPDRPRTPE
jgi:outer membrane protein TolC